MDTDEAARFVRLFLFGQIKIGVFLSNRRGGFPRPPACHSEPLGEESRFVYFALLEILRFAQDDKWGFVVIILCGRAGLAPAAGFDVK